MPNIEEILKKHKVELEGDALASFKTDLFKDFKSVGEIKVLNDKITDLEKDKKQAEKERDSYKTVAEAFGDTKPEDVAKLQGDLETLNKQVKERDEADAQRAKDEAAAKAAAEFEAQFTTALGERKFANDLVKDSVLAAVRKERETDQASGLSDLIEKVTKDKEGIFENKNKPKPNPLPGGGSNEEDEAKEMPSFF